MKRTSLLLTMCGLLLLSSCTDLERELGSEISREDSFDVLSATELINGTYEQLRGFATQDLVWALQEHSGDAVIGPTRGGDWDDNGVWRVLHQHTWDISNNFILNTFNDLSGGVFRSIEVLPRTTGTQRGEALFLQSWFVYYLNDLYGQVPFRDDLNDLTEPARVLSGPEAVDLIVANLEEAITLLPDNSVQWRANKITAKAFLAKVLMNKAVYEKTDRLAPFSFSNSDLTRIVSLCDDVINSGRYNVANGIAYYNNFVPANDALGTEIIFSQNNVRGQPGANVASRYFMTLHYNQNPGGWNGFTTIADFYNLFEDDDIRKGGVDFQGLTDVSGIKAGFLVGQQYDGNGNPLQDRNGNLLIFSIDSPIISSGTGLELTGVRGIKYIPDFGDFQQPDNDYVLLRYSDILLTKAEALLRSGQAGPALTIVNDIRIARGASALPALTENDLINERGRELWWEGHRRTDLIRFGKFLESWNEKQASAGFRVLYPIPETAVLGNPNLDQNPGY